MNYLITQVSKVTYNLISNLISFSTSKFLIWNLIWKSDIKNDIIFDIKFDIIFDIENDIIFDIKSDIKFDIKSDIKFDIKL